MHKILVANIILRILLIVCFIMLAPLGWAICSDMYAREVNAFVITILIGVLISCLFRVIFQRKVKEYDRLNAKDGLAIVGLSWICLSAFGALPLYFSGAVASYTDAIFEVTSGFTTTGASIMTNVEILPRGILFWRSLTHWLGGMGIIVLYLALLPALGQNSFHLYKAEAPGLTAERIQPHIKETAKILWTVYFLFSFVETVLLMLGGMPLFDSLCHTFGTMATGGFSTKNASIGAYGAYTQWVIIVFMFFAGANFMLHYQALRGNLKSFFESEEFRYYFSLIVCMIPLFALVLFFMNLSQSPIRESAFQILSVLTTTGYATANFDVWPHALRFLLIILMFIGGCGGSTGGGLKVSRVVVSVKVAIRSIVQAVYPNAVIPVRFESSALPNRLVVAATAYFTIFVFLFLTGTLLFAFTESCDLVTAFSASIASLSNIGPGLAKVGPTQNYAWVSIPGKWLLIFLMLAGRLELYSILILFVPATWKK